VNFVCTIELAALLDRETWWEWGIYHGEVRWWCGVVWWVLSGRRRSAPTSAFNVTISVFFLLRTVQGKGLYL
jgi:hypothetical protein